MYYMDTQLYECDFCGFTGQLDAHDDIHGTLWECERCGRTFCSACFERRFNVVAMSRNLMDQKLLCPNCYENFVEEDA